MQRWHGAEFVRPCALSSRSPPASGTSSCTRRYHVCGRCLDAGTVRLLNATGRLPGGVGLRTTSSHLPGPAAAPAVSGADASAGGYATERDRCTRRHLTHRLRGFNRPGQPDPGHRGPAPGRAPMSRTAKSSAGDRKVALNRAAAHQLELARGEAGASSRRSWRSTTGARPRRSTMRGHCSVLTRFFEPCMSDELSFTHILRGVYG